jgi:allophanate hydrolase
LSPFLEAARLLYEGPWVAERYSVAGELMEQNPGRAAGDPRIWPRHRRQRGANLPRPVSPASVEGLCDKALAGLDCVLTPTIGRPVTLAELEADRCCATRTSVTTNFMNLLDYAAVAVPSGFMKNGLPWGVTLFGRAFTDQYLLSVADACSAAGSTDPAPTTAARNDRARLVVCGAHLDGLALNWQFEASWGPAGRNHPEFA